MAQGFPDWQRQTLWQGDTLVEDTAASHTANVNYPVQFVGNWLSVQAQLSIQDQPQALTLQWFTDAAATDGLGGETVVLDSPGQANLAVANRGPFLLPSIANRNPAALGHYGFRLVPSNRPSPGIYALAPTFVIQQTALAVGAGAAVVAREVAKWAGPVHVYVATTAAVWSVALESEDLAGNVHTWGYLSNATGPANQMLSAFVPPEIIRATLSNGDAAGRTFTLNIIPDQTAV